MVPFVWMISSSDTSKEEEGKREKEREREGKRRKERNLKRIIGLEDGISIRLFDHLGGNGVQKGMRKFSKPDLEES